MHYFVLVFGSGVGMIIMHIGKNRNILELLRKTDTRVRNSYFPAVNSCLEFDAKRSHSR